jgi:glycosyltransferase involved in cell wall biosynthesis
MTSSQKPHLLFAAYMAGGNATIFANLQHEIAGRSDVDSAWVPIEMDEESKRWGRHGERRRRSLVPGTVRNSIQTGKHIRALEESGRKFDAAWFFQQTICMFLWRFRSRVPYTVGMDGTPLWYAKHQLWYAHHRFDRKKLLERAKHVLNRRLYRQAFHLFPLSAGVRASLLEDYDVPPERVTILPPGVDTRTFVCADRRASARADRPLNLLFVGADFERKGGDLLTTLALQPEFKDVEFHLATRWYQGPEAKNIHVYRDLVTQTPPMLALYEKADLFVLPTRADSHSIATLEAMATGLPVITTPIGGIVDIVEDGKTGYFVPSDDLAALADRIQALRRDPELRLRMGAAGRKTIEERFDNERIAATVVDILKQAAASRS